jgi:hypothetical protein
VLAGASRGGAGLGTGLCRSWIRFSGRATAGRDGRQRWLPPTAWPSIIPPDPLKFCDCRFSVGPLAADLLSCRPSIGLTVVLLSDATIIEGAELPNWNASQPRRAATWLP